MFHSQKVSELYEANLDVFKGYNSNVEMYGDNWFHFSLGVKIYHIIQLVMINIALAVCIFFHFEIVYTIHMFYYNSL